MSKPTEEGKKYIQLTDNILLEYVYVKDRYVNGDIDEDVIGYDESEDVIKYGTYGRASNLSTNNTNKYVIARNDYTQEWYFMNDTISKELTNNSMNNTVLPLNKDASQWVKMTPIQGKYYSEYDSKWCSNLDTTSSTSAETGLIQVPRSDEYIPYDIVRIYFQSGYHTDYDGFIFNAYVKDNTNKYINLLCTIFDNYDNVKMVPEPMWFADKIYTTYVEYRIPSVGYMSTSAFWHDSMSKDVNDWAAQNYSYDREHPDSNTLPGFLTMHDSSSPVGFYENPCIGFDLHGIVGYTIKHGHKILKSKTLTSTLFPNKDVHDNIIANVRNSTVGDYYEIYGYRENDPVQPIYDADSLYEYLVRFPNTFTLIHTITVIENWTDENGILLSESQTPMTYIQTWESLENMYEAHTSPAIKFRPVLEHASSMLNQNYGATINYTLRILNNRDNTSIIKTSSCAILNPRRFGLTQFNANLIGTNQIRVYNRIEKSPDLNIAAVVSPINAPKNISSSANNIVVNKYVTSSFIDRRNIRVSVSPVKISNI